MLYYADRYRSPGLLRPHRLFRPRRADIGRPARTSSRHPAAIAFEGLDPFLGRPDDEGQDEGKERQEAGAEHDAVQSAVMSLWLLIPAQHHPILFNLGNV